MSRVFKKLEEAHLAGPLAVAIFVFAYDVFAIQRNKSTISRDVQHLKNLGYGPEVSGAIAGLLLFHLLFRDR